MALSLQQQVRIRMEAREQAAAGKRSASAFREALPYGALVGVYLRERLPHTATMGRFAGGRWYVETEPERSPVFVRRCLVYGQGAKKTAHLHKSDLRSWLRTRDVKLETLVAALRELKVLVGPPAGRRIAMAAKTKVVGVPATAIEVSLDRLSFLSRKGDIGKLGAAWGDGSRQ